MNFNEFAASEHINNVSFNRALEALPSEEKERINLYSRLIKLSEGTTNVDKERGFRASSTVAGYGFWEEAFRAIPQAAIDDGTIHGVNGVHYNFTEHVAGDHVQTGVFFDVEGNVSSIELSEAGCIALKILEKELQGHPKVNCSIKGYKAQCIAALNKDLSEAGHVPIIVSDLADEKPEPHT